MEMTLTVTPTTGLTLQLMADSATEAADNLLLGAAYQLAVDNMGPSVNLATLVTELTALGQKLGVVITKTTISAS